MLRDKENTFLGGGGSVKQMLTVVKQKYLYSCFFTAGFSSFNISDWTLQYNTIEYDIDTKTDITTTLLRVDTTNAL